MMAALALMTGACSNDNELTPQQPDQTGGIPFIATISGNRSATTRALTEDTENGKIVATWTEGEQVALIYKVGNKTCNATATVEEVDEEGTATISATLDAGTEEGTEVTIIYPATAVDLETFEVRSDLLEGQDGTLANISQNLDLHTGKGNLSIDGIATLQQSVKLDSHLAIFKLTLNKMTDKTHAGSNDFTSLVVSYDDANGGYHVAASVNLPGNTNEFYVALEPATLPEYPMLWFEATTSTGKNYINHGTAKAVSLEKKYYHSTVSLATVGDVVGANGKFYTDKNAAMADDNKTEAIIAYVGGVENYFSRFLAIAQDDVDAQYHKWSQAPAAVGTFAANHPITLGKEFNTNAGGDSSYDQVANNPNTASNTHTGAAPKGWRLPSVTDWRYIFQGMCKDAPSATNPVGIGNSAYYGYAKDLAEAINHSSEWDVEDDFYWTSSEYGNEAASAWCYEFNHSGMSKMSKSTGGFVRAVFAY